MKTTITLFLLVVTTVLVCFKFYGLAFYYATLCLIMLMFLLVKKKPRQQKSITKTYRYKNFESDDVIF